MDGISTAIINAHRKIADVFLLFILLL